MRSALKSPPSMDPAAAAGFAAARRLCRREAKQFFFTTAFLSPSKRNAVCAVQAFCGLMSQAINPPKPREATDCLPTTVGSACCSTSSVDKTLSLFRERLDDIYAGRLELPLPEFRDESQHALHAFSLTVHRYQIPQQYFLDLADGYRMDLTISRYATWNALEKYCARSGGVIVLMMSCILGLTHSDAGRHAVQMGKAIALTRMLRDIPRDVERGVLYLPLEDLARFRITQKDLAAGRVTHQFRDLMKFEIARARDLYRQGAEGLCWLEGDGSRMMASAIAALQSGVLGAIERQGYDVFSKRPRLTAAEKFRRLSLAWRLARRKADEALPKTFR